MPDPETGFDPTVEDTFPEVHVIRRVQDPVAVAADGSVIVMPVIGRTFPTTTDPVAGPLMTGLVGPDVCDPDTVPLDATAFAAVMPTATADVAAPALFVAVTSKSYDVAAERPVTVTEVPVIEPPNEVHGDAPVSRKNGW